jgi:hypothetical protein
VALAGISLHRETPAFTPTSGQVHGIISSPTPLLPPHSLQICLLHQLHLVLALHVHLLFPRVPLLPHHKHLPHLLQPRVLLLLPLLLQLQLLLLLYLFEPLMGRLWHFSADQDSQEIQIASYWYLSVRHHVFIFGEIARCVQKSGGVRGSHRDHCTAC